MGCYPYADHRAADAESRHHEISDDQRHPSVLDWFGNLWRNFAFTPLAGPFGISAISLPLAAHEHGLPLESSIDLPHQMIFGNRVAKMKLVEQLTLALFRPPIMDRPRRDSPQHNG